MYTTISDAEETLEDDYIEPHPPDAIIEGFHLVPIPELNHDVMIMLDQVIEERCSKEEEHPYDEELSTISDNDDLYKIYKHATIHEMRTAGVIEFTKETLSEFIGFDIPLKQWDSLQIIAPSGPLTCNISFSKLNTFVAGICGRYLDANAWMHLRNRTNSYEIIKASCLEEIETRITQNAGDYVYPITNSMYMNRGRLQILMGEIPLQLLPWRVFAMITANGLSATYDKWITNNSMPSYDELNGFLCGVGANPISLDEWHDLTLVCNADHDADFPEE